MDFPSNTELLIAVGGAIAAAWRALAGRRNAQTATDAEIERWAKVAAERAWQSVRRDDRILLSPTFQRELTRLAEWAGVTIPVARARRVLAIAVETWVRLTALEAGAAAERLLVQIDKLTETYERFDNAARKSG